MGEQGVRPQLLATRLYDAALEGDVTTLLNLLREDPLILDRCSIEKTGRFLLSPLHVAANLGHLGFTTEILHRKPDMCFARDQDGRNPVHVAAITGQVHVLDELHRANSQAAREQTAAGETVLHLCVKHNQPEGLMSIVNLMDDGELLNTKDSKGNTVLHLAVAAKLPEIVEFLLEDKRMEKNTINANGLTAMDTLVQSKKDLNDRMLWKSLEHAKALRAKEALKPRGKSHEWLENRRNALMVVASLIATMAFQVAVNPPGGAWQDDEHGHIAGSPIMADKHKAQYDRFLIYNTVGLISSLSVILLLISGLPLHQLFVVILMIIMWIAVTATSFTYSVSVDFLSPKKDSTVTHALHISIYVWVAVTVFLLLSHIARFTAKLIKQLVLLIIKLCKKYYASSTSRQPI